MPRGSGVRRHTCPTCARSYGKAEHLIRHERTHSGIKPFVCEICGRKFSRQDSLSRHQRRHDHFSSPQSGSPDALPVQRRPTFNGPPDLDRPSSNRNGSVFQNDNLNYTRTRKRLQEVNGPRHSDQARNTENVNFDLQGELRENDLSPHTIQLPDELMTDSQDLNLSGDALDDPFLQFTWPGSEDLLQSILSTNLAPLSENVEILPSNYVFNSTQIPEQIPSPWLTHEVEPQTHGGSHAVRNVSQIISDASADVTSEAASTGLSANFLNASLHMFFDQFTTRLPVCHRPTFIFRNWTHPLLINSIALGSLFVGEASNISKGEILWKLAHTAVATSWHTLLMHQGPYDSCNGVQLILTALLGQTYAMLSKNTRLRATAQVFHSLGFYWARKCDMYNGSQKFNRDEALASSSIEQRLEHWNRWAAEETHLRSLLGHYILDGLLTHFTGAPTCQRHAANDLRLPCSEHLFQAPTLDEWTENLRAENLDSTTFRQLFLVLLSNPSAASALPSNLSSLTMTIVIEGMKSFISESNSVSGIVAGSPSNLTMSQALGSIHQYLSNNDSLLEGEKTELLLRWHAVSLDAAYDSTTLCRSLCGQFGVDEDVFGRFKEGENVVDLISWTQSSRGRCALLHATSIWDIFTSLPFGRSHAIHIPVCIFASAIVYFAFVLSGTHSVTIPRNVDWKRLMSIDLDNDLGNAHHIDSRLAQYLSGSSNFPKPQTRNLFYDSNMFLLHLRRLSKPWGICLSLESILQQWLSQCET